MMKRVCILGCLNNKAGNAIKDEMLAWLKQYYDVFVVSHDGTKFEYPAIYYTIKASIELNQPILYLHTKGAAHDYIWIRTPRNNQTEIRKFWKREFTKNADAYFDYDNSSTLVTTPMLEDDGKTIFNAFVLYPNAAKLLQKTFHLDSNRFYYEDMFSSIPEIELKGIVKHRAPESEIRHYIETGVFDE